MMRKSAFKYDQASDGYRCPQGELLTYATTDRSGYVRPGALPLLPVARFVHRQRQSRAHHHPPCLEGRARAKRRQPTDALGQTYLQATQGNGGAIFRRRQASLRPPRYARFRGLVRVSSQCLLAAAAQNIKKIALIHATKTAPAAARASTPESTSKNEHRSRTKQTPPKI